MNFIKDLSIDKIQNLAEDAYNQAKPKTDVEARVYEVLSHKNWGASGSLMNEIARDTYDMERFQVVAGLMWDGMENQRPAAWKVVFKSLTLLEHLVKNGAERCVDDARNHGHVLRSLGQFNYYEGTIDRGLGVREKSKQILEVLSDDDRIREERQKARKLREKFGDFNKGASGMGGGGDSMGGYGNQDSWNNGGGTSGGYGEGGIYDNAKGYSGRYGNSSSTPSASTPTFAAMPGESTKKKSKKKKKKQTAAAELEPAPVEPEQDLLGFDDPTPAPTAGTSRRTSSSEFGAFQASPAPAPAPADASDDFASFGQMRAERGQGPDPFAAPVAAATPGQQQNASFDAFGNNTTVSNTNKNRMENSIGAPNAINNNMMANNNMSNTGAPMSNNMMMNNNIMSSNNNDANGLNGIGDAFGNMNVGNGTPAGVMAQQFQQPSIPASNDDDFGDFSDAKATTSPTFAKATNSSDPLSKLINLDGLSKNPSNKMTMNQPVVANAAAAQYQQDIQQGVQASVVVSAGGSNAISSMMGPASQQQQRGSIMSMNSQDSAGGSGGISMNPQMQKQQQQFMMNQGIQGNNINMMGGNPQVQQGMMYGNQMSGGGGMNNMNMNQMGMNQGQQQMNHQMMGSMGMQGGMNQMGMQGGMNQMGMQGGMNQMGMQGGFNQMGVQQQMNPQMMGGMGMQGDARGQQQMR